MSNTSKYSIVSITTMQTGMIIVNLSLFSPVLGMTGLNPLGYFQHYVVLTNKQYHRMTVFHNYSHLNSLSKCS